MKRRVVVTGIGLLTPLGTGIEKNWKALSTGTSGIGRITRFDPSLLTSQIAGEVVDFNALDYMDKAVVRRFDVFVHYAVAAAKMAVEDAALKIDPSEAHRVGCITGTGFGGFEKWELFHKTYLEKGPRRISPFFVPGIIANMVPGQLSIEFGAKGPNMAIETACAASAHATGEAFRLIRDGISDAVITGGVEAPMTPLVVGGFGSMRALCTQNDEPEKASRPFDLNRTGFVIAEGSGILILEELNRALARGAKIYAEMVGYGMSSDAYHITAPDPKGEGARICMQMALDFAGLRPEDIDYINAHGTSTKLNDLSENRAVKRVFGEHAYKLAISSTKSMTGHLLGGAGGTEASFTVLAIKNGMMPPTINYETPDPECDLDYVPNKARKANIRYAMSNSFGFGGTNASLIFKKYRRRKK